MDIPVPQGGGRHADLQGFLRGHSSTGVEQIVDTPGGGLHRPGQSSSSADEPGEGVFRTFPQNKKSATLGPHSSLRVPASVSSSTLAAQLEAEEAKEKEERKAKYEEKMLVVNRRVRDGTATPAEEAAWRRWMGLDCGGSSSSSVKRRKKKKRRKWRRVTTWQYWRRRSLRSCRP